MCGLRSHAAGVPKVEVYEALFQKPPSQAAAEKDVEDKSGAVQLIKGVGEFG